jgi:hypothetical protein
VTENELQSRIRKALELMGFWVERQQSGKSVKVRRGRMRLASPGTPDLLIVAPVYAWIEVKLPGEKLNANQVKWHARARRAGLLVVVVESTAEAVLVALQWRRRKASA